MSQLSVTLRNDYLRISIPDGHVDAIQLNAMQSEFVECLQSATFSDVVIVDLPSVSQLDTGLVSMLLTWYRIASLAGRKFRMNGISRVVSQVQQQMSARTNGTPNGPHRLRNAQYASV